MTGDEYMLHLSSFSKLVGALFLLLWDLNKLYFKVVNLVLHLLKVLLHPFILAFIVPLNLTGYYLGIVVYD